MTTETLLRPNDPATVNLIQTRGFLNRRWPVVMTLSRIMLFAAWQALFALAFSLSGAQNPWLQSIPWWPIGATLTNLVGYYLLVRLFDAEGLRYRDLLRIDRQNLGSDMLVMVGTLIITSLIALLPNVWLATALFGDPQEPMDLLVRALPLWAAAAALVLFPVTQGLVELPTYFGYAEPRLEIQWESRWKAVLFTGIFLGIQHAAIPLIFDWRFITWRAAMYIPLGIWLAFLLSWRPRLMPYFVLMHILIDLSAVWFTLAASLP